MDNCPVCFCRLNDQNMFITNCCEQKSCEICYNEWTKYSNSCFFCRFLDNSIEIVTNSHDMISESSSDSENDIHLSCNKQLYAICFYMTIMIGSIIILFVLYV